jgi:hypothetical protein
MCNNRLRKLSDEGSFWTEATIPTSHVRVTAGICVLAAGLLFGAGGGAIAGADTDPSSSSGPSQGADGTSQSTGAGTVGRTGTAAETEPKASTLSEDTGPSGSPDEGAREEEPTNTATDEENGGSAGDGTSGRETGTTVPDSGSTGTDSTETSPESTVPAESSTSSNPGPASIEPVAPSTPLPPAPPVDPVQPASAGFTDWTDLFSSVPAAVAALPIPPQAITNAIASVLTSVTGVVAPLVQLPSDLYALLGAQAPVGPPPLIGAGSSMTGPPAAAPLAGAPLVGPLGWQVPSSVAPFDTGSLFGTMAPRPGLGAAVPSGMSQPLAVSGTVPVKRGAPTTAQSILEHVIEAVLVPASLTALAALALPGIGGLLVVAAAGVRLGYRQAKAGLALRASGIARFAGPGPLGVVRSGSMVTLRQRARGPRTARAVCPQASRSPRVLEPVA